MNIKQTKWIKYQYDIVNNIYTYIYQLIINKKILFQIYSYNSYILIIIIFCNLLKKKKKLSIEFI